MHHIFKVRFNRIFEVFKANVIKLCRLFYMNQVKVSEIRNGTIINGVYFPRKIGGIVFIYNNNSL